MELGAGPRHPHGHTVRNGSCGDALRTQDVPRVVAALEELDLLTEQTMVAVDDGPSVFPRMPARNARGVVAG